MSDPGREAVFLDRDGVITALVPDDRGVPESPYRPEDVALMPGVGEALRKLNDAGRTLVVASNQPASAKGLVTKAQLQAVHERVIQALGPDAEAISEWRYCNHHPEAENPIMRQCDCRKPKPGMLIEAAARLGIDLRSSWMIGDADRDIQAGAAAGCRTILVENRASAQRRSGSVEPDLRASDLRAAATALLIRER